ncbi:hypothetical protein D3C78_658950 [compost metagenome]
MAIAGDQAQQQAEFLAALAAELSLAGLHQQAIADLEIAQLYLAVLGIEIVPLGSLDLVAVLGGHPIDRRPGGSHECRLGRARFHAATFQAERATIHRNLQRGAGGLEFADRHHAVLGGEPGIGGDARIGRADLLAPPVVVQLVDPVDEDEARFGVVVGGDHDHVPQVTCLDPAVDPAGDPAVLADQVFVVHRPVAPDDVLRVLQVDLVALLLVYREDQRPVGIVVHRFHEAVGDQQAEVELAQAAVFALGADEFAHVRMADVEGAHLRAAAAAGGADGEAHLVVDIHERQRPAGVRAGAGNVGAARAQGAELVADAAAGLECQAGLVDFLQDVVHGVMDDSGDGAVDGGSGRLVALCAGVGNDPSGGNGTVAQCPEEALVPVLALGLVAFDIGQCSRHSPPGTVDAVVDRRAVLLLETVLAVPDVLRGGLQGEGSLVCATGARIGLGHPLNNLLSVGW